MHRDRVDDGTDSSAIGKSCVNDGGESIKTSAKWSENTLKGDLDLSMQ